MTTDQKRQKLIMHYSTLAQIALGAVARLTETRDTPTVRDMQALTRAYNQRIEFRVRETEAVWKQQEMDV